MNKVVQIDPTQPVIYVAIELSRKRWVVAAHLPIADKISRFDIAGGDSRELLALLGRLADRVKQKLSQRPMIVSCFEAGFDGFWLHRVLEQQGIRNFVLDATSILVSRRARRPKTDRLDAEAMIRVLLALCRGESKVCSVVQVPTPEQEDARHPHRERERLVGERIQHVNRIQGLLATQGITGFRPMRRDWQDQLEQLQTGDGQPPPPRLAAEIRRECQRLALVIEMLHEVEADRDAVCAASQDNVARRKSFGSHVLYYMPAVVEDEPLFVLLRVLHERRDPTEAVTGALEQAWQELFERTLRDE